MDAYTRLQQDVVAKVSRMHFRLEEQELTRPQKKSKEYSPEALHATNQLLDLNPEYYTIWNYRRHILVNGLFPGS